MPQLGCDFIYCSQLSKISEGRIKWTMVNINSAQNTENLENTSHDYLLAQH